MELQDLKQKWNILDERLAQNEILSKRALQESICGKNKTMYENVQKGVRGNLIGAALIALLLIPSLHNKGIFHDVDFYIMEGVCVLAVIMILCRMFVASRFDVTSTLQHQLKNLVNYNRCVVFENVIGTPLAIIAICVTLYIEHTATAWGAIFVVLGAVAGAFSAWYGWKKHKSTIQEIEKNLAELKDFE